MLRNRDFRLFVCLKVQNTHFEKIFLLTGFIGSSARFSLREVESPKARKARVRKLKKRERALRAHRRKKIMQELEQERMRIYMQAMIYR